MIWRKKSRRLMLMLTILAPIFAADASAMSGNELFDQCKTTLNKAVPLGNLAALCSGYVRGFVEGYGFTLSLMSLTGSAKMCVPPSATIGQTVDVVTKFLNEHPQDRHLSATALTFAALARAFPCVDK